MKREDWMDGFAAAVEVDRSGLVGASALVRDHGEPVGCVDQADQADQGGDLVVVVWNWLRSRATAGSPST